MRGSTESVVHMVLDFTLSIVLFSFCLFPSISCTHGTMKGDYYLITYYSSNAAAKCTSYFRVSTDISLKGCCHLAID